MKIYTFFSLLLASTTVCAACNSYSSSKQSAPAIGSPPATQEGRIQDKELMAQIDKFIGGQASEREQAWERLQGYPRNELIDRLSRAKQEIPDNDLRNFEIAFVLCNLDYEYQANKEKLISSLDPSRKSQIPSDLAAELIIRMIQRGDKDLLASLFVAADRADGALAEELSAFFLARMQTDPKDFLKKLSEQPQARRREVYRLIFSETTFTANDAKKIKAQLETIKTDPQLAETADEILKFLRSTKTDSAGTPD